MFSPSVLVLGAGRVGRAIALDLSRRYKVTVADRDERALSILRQEAPSLTFITVDFTQRRSLIEAAAPFTLVISAVPGSIGFTVVDALIQARKNVVDISFFPEDPFLLEEQAVKHGVTVVVDCGVAPGLCNLLLGHHLSTEEIETYECLVGGLPKERPWPYQYKAPFSPADVLEEYTRPVHQRIKGQMVIKPPLSEVELVEVPGLGTLEAFNTDGLRTLLRTTSVPTLREKTLRYPGHAEYIQVLGRTGFFSDEPISLSGHPVRPRDFTLQLLSRVWYLSPEEEDILIMLVQLRGHQGNEATSYTYEVRDEGDRINRISAMARTTGYTCTAVATLLLEGAEFPKGIFPPEEIGKRKDWYQTILAYLKERGIHIKRLSSLIRPFEVNFPS